MKSGFLQDPQINKFTEHTLLLSRFGFAYIGEVINSVNNAFN